MLSTPISWITSYSEGEYVVRPEIEIELAGTQIRYKAFTFVYAGETLSLPVDGVKLLNFLDTAAIGQYVCRNRTTGAIELCDFYDNGMTLIMVNQETHQQLFMAWRVNLDGLPLGDHTIRSHRVILSSEEELRSDESTAQLS